jgi:hypothetical protein
LFALLILIAFAVGFGTPSSDAEKMRAFAEAVERWQHNPEFRQVRVEYVEMGSDAMRTRVCWMDATRCVMALRSLPGLPEHLRVNDTSFAHYTNFTKGPLSAYLHLTAEQGLADTVKMLKELGAKPNPSDEDVRAFLKQYTLHYPVVSDAGAVRSVRSLLADVDPGRGFAIEKDMAERLKPHIARIAGEMGYPADAGEMTSAQQRDVWLALDGHIKEHDYELWRTKQVSDWLSGVWAQVYGTMYSGLIYPMLGIRDVARVAAPVMLMAWLAWAAYRRRRAVEQPLPALQARLAVEGGELPTPASDD